MSNAAIVERLLADLEAARSAIANGRAVDLNIVIELRPGQSPATRAGSFANAVPKPRGATPIRLKCSKQFKP